MPSVPSRIVSDGHFYTTDQSVLKALDAVKAVDPHAAADLLTRWRDAGVVKPDHGADQRAGLTQTERPAGLAAGTDLTAHPHHGLRVGDLVGISHRWTWRSRRLCRG